MGGNFVKLQSTTHNNYLYYMQMLLPASETIQGLY